MTHDIIEFAHQENVEMVDLKYTDLIGKWKHITLPFHEFDEELFENGIGFDSSSVAGFKGVEASDLNIVPDTTTAFIDPAWNVRTISIICDVVESDSKRPFSGDPRFVAKKARKYLVDTGIADEDLWGPEIEFYILDRIRYRQGKMCGYYYIESREASDESEYGKECCFGYKNPQMGGYHVVPPSDSLHNIRAEMMKALERCGVRIKYHHHEAGGPGQMEFEIKHEPLVKAADTVMLMKYIIKNLAVRYCKTATFMPKPISQEATNALHVHQRLFLNSTPIFYDKQGYSNLSKTALYYIGGLLKHTPALLALTSPTINSYKRFFPLSEEPTKLTFSSANRTACIRIPAYGNAPREKRIEYRAQDAGCNIYLAMAALLMAGLDGIQNKIDPTIEGFGPYDCDIDKLSENEKMKIKSLPNSLKDALECLRRDNEFLTRGGVFTEELIEKWIEYKIRVDVVPFERLVHPFEYCLYYDS